MTNPIIFGSVSSAAEIPDNLQKLTKLDKTNVKGVPEVNHPLDFWEIVSLKEGKRYTNYPGWEPLFYTERPNPALQGWDFDRALPPTVISMLLNCDMWFWRPSTKGIHILADLDLSVFQDPIRQEVVNLRGYEWFWVVKDGKKHLPWRRGTYMDAIRLQGYLRYRK